MHTYKCTCDYEHVEIVVSCARYAPHTSYARTRVNVFHNSKRIIQNVSLHCYTIILLFGYFHVISSARACVCLINERVRYGFVRNLYYSVPDSNGPMFVCHETKSCNLSRVAACHVKPNNKQRNRVNLIDIPAVT